MVKSKIYITLFIFMLVLLSGTQAATKHYAQIYCHVPVCQIGEFPKSKPVHVARFTIRNIGNIPLVIDKIDVQCGCTSVSYNKEPIKPGKLRYIYAKYNGSKKHSGHFYTGIIISSNSKDDNPLFLYLRGDMLD